MKIRSRSYRTFRKVNVDFDDEIFERLFRYKEEFLVGDEVDLAIDDLRFPVFIGIGPSREVFPIEERNLLAARGRREK